MQTVVRVYPACSRPSIKKKKERKGGKEGGRKKGKEKELEGEEEKLLLDR